MNQFERITAIPNAWRTGVQLAAVLLIVVAIVISLTRRDVGYIQEILTIIYAIAGTCVGLAFKIRLQKASAAQLTEAAPPTSNVNVTEKHLEGFTKGHTIYLHVVV